MKGLSPKQEKFIYEFIRTGNATQAYLNAYGGKSKPAAQACASKLLLNPKVKAELEKLREDFRGYYKFEMDDYIQQLLKIVGADIGDFVKFGRRDEEVVINKNGDTVIQKRNFVDLVDSETVDTSLISEIRQIKGDVTIKLHDKISALKELARILGFGENFNEENVPIIITGELELPD